MTRRHRNPNGMRASAFGAALSTGSREPAPSASAYHPVTYHERHLCRRCGHRFGEHAGAHNPLCPPHRCPGTRFPRITDDGPATDAAIKAFWNERTTEFTPA